MKVVVFGKTNEVILAVIVGLNESIKWSYQSKAIFDYYT